MRDPGFVAEHRGGLLRKIEHQQLMLWAILCIEHLVQTNEITLHPELQLALNIARDWQKGLIKTGPAMQAARRAHALARTFEDPQHVLIARAVGHAVATAHAADHAFGAALYGNKLLKLSGRDLAIEQDWQLQALRDLALPESLFQLFLTTLKQKALHFKVAYPDI